MKCVLFFDGECLFCSRSVRWIYRLDRRGNISFASLQGSLAGRHGFSNYAARNGGSMVLMRESDGKCFIESDAVIEIANALGGWWRIFTVARVILKPLRDFGYRLFARNRHRLAGRQNTCAMAAPEFLKRLRN